MHEVIKMNSLIVTGKQEFMGLDIPVVLGGFGEGKKCISDKTIAEIHGMEVKNVRARITDNIKRFNEGVDFIDVKQGACEASTLEFLLSLGYAKQSITQAEHIYILSERGYAKLIKIMDTDLAWKIHDKLMDEYFQLREEMSKKVRVDVDQILGDPDFGIRLLTAYKEEKEKNAGLQQEIQLKEEKISVMRPKEIFADSVSESESLILVRDLAKLLRQNGVDIGEKRLYAWMRENGYIIKSSNPPMPTQRAMDMGLFRVIERTITSGTGTTIVSSTTKVTGKGQQYFINKFIGDGADQIAMW